MPAASDYQRAFEADLNELWQRRDFSAWNETRSIYADWLEENDHPLWAMARARCTMLSTSVPSPRGPRVWAWRLYFDLPPDVSIGPHWARNQRVNRDQLLGFPSTTLRCMGIEENQCGRLARFTLTFKERREKRWVRLARGVLANAGKWVDLAYDTDLNPCGFAAMFWPRDWRPRGEKIPSKEPTLFDQLDAGR